MSIRAVSYNALVIATYIYVPYRVALYTWQGIGSNIPSTSQRHACKGRCTHLGTLVKVPKTVAITQEYNVHHQHTGAHLAKLSSQKYMPGLVSHYINNVAF